MRDPCTKLALFTQAMMATSEPHGSYLYNLEREQLMHTFFKKSVTFGGLHHEIVERGCARASGLSTWLYARAFTLLLPG